jgi:hypothetical protein
MDLPVNDDLISPDAASAIYPWSTHPVAMRLLCQTMLRTGELRLRGEDTTDTNLLSLAFCPDGVLPLAIVLATFTASTFEHFGDLMNYGTRKQ